jgi:hypothetical protein
VSKIFQIIGWPIPAIGCEEYTDLNELFSWEKIIFKTLRQFSS